MRILGAKSLSSFWESILTIFWVICWFVAIAFVVVPLFVDENSFFQFPVRLDQGGRHELEGLGGTWTVTPIEVQLKTPHAYTKTAAWTAAVLFALGAYVLGLLRGVFRSLRDGSPFIAANARRFRRMGLTVLMIEALRLLATRTLVAPVIESLEAVEGQGWRVDLWPNWTLVFLACVFLILADVFQRGTAMQDEQEHTI